MCGRLIFLAELLESPVVSEKSQQILGIADITVTVPGVEKLLKDIKSHKAAGPDEIPGRGFRECADSIVQVLTKIFSKSLTSGSLPRD